VTAPELSALLHAVKRSHWNPEVGMKMFLRHHTHLEPTPEMYGYAICVGRTPFPNIVGLPEGPYPEDKKRPWHDTRMWNRPEQAEWEREMREL
jgi:hypothetical protein